MYKGLGIRKQKFYFVDLVKFHNYFDEHNLQTFTPCHTWHIIYRTNCCNYNNELIFSKHIFQRITDEAVATNTCTNAEKKSQRDSVF
jgi:hypothetical protein